MSDPLLQRSTQCAVTHLTLNSPHSLNALSVAMLTALQGELARIATDPTCRVVVLSGAGKAFCAGHDLREMQAARSQPDGGAATYRALFDQCSALMMAIAALPQPVIAQCHGVAAAAGCQLAAACDMVTAADTCRFGVNGINIGLFCSTPLVALRRKIAPSVACELASTGVFVSAARAIELGLVNRVAPPDQLDATTQDLARILAQKLPSALRLGKAAMRAADGDLAADYARASAIMVANLMQPDTAEGIAAFLDKRPPYWA